MKKIATAAMAAFLLAACHSGEQFTIKGNVSDAASKTLYLEAATLTGLTVLDSVTLKSNGSFSFNQPRPESPEFFRLRVDNKTINLAVDSTETVVIEAPFNGFSTDYVVQGSDNNIRIKELSVKQINLQRQINELIAAVRANRLAYTVFEDSLASVMKNYKDDVKMNYIFSAPNTSAAYFALFQKANDLLIFDPLNSKDDVKCFAAVATSLDAAYPHAIRTKNLYNIVIKGMKNTREPREQIIELPADKMVETGLIDINLRDLRGQQQKLTELKGKVVLLDFTVYQSQNGSTHNLMLRDLYNKYASQGLEIYQVSLDADEHFWKTSADNLPWICVRDENGVYSTNAALYNVRELPSIFLINRANELQIRGEDIKDLEKTIQSML